MKSFKQFLNEETMPYATNARGVIDIEDSSVRDGLNSQLAGVTASKFVTPYIALERVTKALANYHIFIPRHSFLEGDSGMLVWPINQFGIKFGQQDNGEFVQNGEVLKDTSKGVEPEGEDNKVIPVPNKEVDRPFSVFFEYRQSDCGMFNVFCEIVSQEELDEILADLEDEMNDDDEDEEDEEELNEQKVSTRASDSSNDEPMKDRVTIPGASTPVPSSSFSPRVPTRSTKGLDHMNRDEEGNTVVEGNKENKAKKNQAIKQAAGGKKNLRDIRSAMKGPIKSSFDPRALKVAEETKD